jgi:deoxyribose-phosphate aldolase
MRIALGADHGGYQLKEELTSYLKLQGHDVLDLGTSSTKAVDYPVFAHKVAQEVASGRCDRGIMVDGAGIGSAMAANKIPGIRAAMAYDISSAVNSREHNNANVLTLGAGHIGPNLARQIVHAWLSATCTEERHLRRASMIEAVDTIATRREPAASSQEPLAEVVDNLQLSDDDLERIAARLNAMLENAGVAGAVAATIRPTGPSIATSPETARKFINLGAGRLTTGPSPGKIPKDIAALIDHTLLKPDATIDEIRRLCSEAKEFGFAAVCVNPVWVKLVREELRGSEVVTCSVVGFPLGATHPETKAFEARRAIREGAEEIDMVINVGALKSGDDEYALKDIRAVVEACRDGSAICKVIIETALLCEEEKRTACRLARKARAHFVKTSTGFAAGGATAHDVALMSSEVRDAGMEVKASGGIRSYADAKRMIEAGATRVGASAGVAIVQEAEEVTVSE